MAGRKLKVFQAQFGFYDTVVAAPSQAAALRAWGIHQDLFAGGQARITDDPQAVEAALANPETPLKRAVGSKEPFALEATSLPSVPDPPKKPAASKLTAKAPSKPEPTPRPPADRSDHRSPRPRARDCSSRCRPAPRSSRPSRPRTAPAPW